MSPMVVDSICSTLTVVIFVKDLLAQKIIPASAYASFTTWAVRTDSSQAKAILLLQTGDAALEQQATERGVGVVHRLEDVIEVLLQLQEFLPEKRGVVMRLADWFRKKEPESHVLPMNPRSTRPIPPHAE